MNSGYRSCLFKDYVCTNITEYAVHDFYTIVADLCNDFAENWHISQVSLQFIETSHSRKLTSSVHMMHILLEMHPIVLYNLWDVNEILIVVVLRRTASVV
jgi:hypothetical protein